MQLPVQITFRHMDRSDALEQAIRDHADRLNAIHPRISSCRVVVEEVAAHKHQGKLFALHLDLKIPHREIAVTRHEHEDVYVALRDAFDAAKRKLSSEAHIDRGEVKQHRERTRGEPDAEV